MKSFSVRASWVHGHRSNGSCVVSLVLRFGAGAVCLYQLDQTLERMDYGRLANRVAVSCKTHDLAVGLTQHLPAKPDRTHRFSCAAAVRPGNAGNGHAYLHLRLPRCALRHGARYGLAHRSGAAISVKQALNALGVRGSSY